MTKTIHAIYEHGVLKPLEPIEGSKENTEVMVSVSVGNEVTHPLLRFAGILSEDEANKMLKIAEARLKDAEVLFNSKRYEGAIYLCGYAAEVALKARICSTLRWNGYPMTSNEFKNVASEAVGVMECISTAHKVACGMPCGLRNAAA